MAEFSIKWLDETDSTNRAMADEKSVLKEGDVICARRQSAGRGQRGNIWKSADGMNLTFSFLLRPSFLNIREQACISQAVSLGIANYLKSRGLTPSIKWPNDIYIADRKICGILIENTLSGSNLADCIIGIGLNVNQTEFSPDIPNPTSMKRETNTGFDLHDELPVLIAHIMEKYGKIAIPHDRNYVEHSYTSLLYRRGQWHTFEILESSSIPTEKRNGTAITARILGIDDSFRLILEHLDGTTHSYSFKELKYVIGG